MFAIDSDTVEIKTKNGFSALISRCDLDLISGRIWTASVLSKKFYARRFENGDYVLMHRLIMGLLPADGLYVDHINGNSLDNRRSNLRICTMKENCWNRRKTNSVTGFHGVRKSKDSDSYVVRFYSNGKYHYVGCFKSAIEAADAYNKEIILHRGKFAVLNDIDHDELDAVLSARK